MDQLDLMNLFFGRLNNQELIIKLDTISIIDSNPIKQLIKKCFFEKIIIQGDELINNYESGGGIEEKPYNRNRSNSKTINISNLSKSASKPTTANSTNNNFYSIKIQPKTPKGNTTNDKIDKTKMKLSKNMREVESLLSCISHNIKSNPNLSIIKIQGFKLTVECLEALSYGIKENNSLKELYINNCDLTTHDMEILCGAIANNTNINVIDISKNRLDDHCGMLIGKIISSHAERRDQIVWLYSIRGDKPEEDVEFKGLCDLNLSYNQIGSNVIKDIFHRLQYDTWIRNINLRGNKIDDIGINEIANVLENNNSLFSVDLRDNPFYNSKISKKILYKLTLNIQNYKNLNFEYSNENRKGCTSDFHEKSGDMKPLEQYLDDSIKNNEETRNIPNFKGIQLNNPDVHQIDSKKAKDIQLKLKEVNNNNEISEDPEGIEELIDKYHLQNDADGINGIVDKNFEKSISFGEKKDNKYNKQRLLYNSDMKMHSLNHGKNDDNNLNTCENCRLLEKKLFVSESKILNLQFENFKLKKALQGAFTPNANQLNSCSGFTPNLNEGEQAQQAHYDSISLNAGQPGIQPSDEMFNRIEYLMGELTRMMDSLENAQNNITNNYTGHFTNSTNQTNNNTYQLINSVNNINFNTTYTNILNSNNNSRVNNLHASNHYGQNREQTLSNIQNNQMKESSKSFSRSSNHKNNLNPNNSENNPFSQGDKSAISPRDKSAENIQSQAISQYSMFFRDENSH